MSGNLVTDMDLKDALLRVRGILTEKPFPPLSVIECVALQVVLDEFDKMRRERLQALTQATNEAVAKDLAEANVELGPQCSCPEWWFPADRQELRNLPHGYGGALAHYRSCPKWFSSSRDDSLY